jgi:hypothetical protein
LGFVRRYSLPKQGHLKGEATVTNKLEFKSLGQCCLLVRCILSISMYCNTCMLKLCG